MNLQQTIDQVATNAGIDPSTAEHAVGTILSVISQELDPKTSASVFSRLPDAARLAQAHPLQNQNSIFGTIAGTVLGNRGSVLAAGLVELQGLGLTEAQLQNIGSGLRKYAEDNGGATVVREIASAVPGLSAYLG